MCGLAAPPHQPSPGGPATAPRLGVCPPPARLRAAPWSCRLPLKGGVMSISWERGRPARILSLPALPPPPVPPVKPAEVAVPDSLPQNAPSRPPSRAFLARGSPRGSVRGCSWRGLGGAVRCGRGAPESPPTRLRLRPVPTTPGSRPVRVQRGCEAGAMPAPSTGGCPCRWKLLTGRRVCPPPARLRAPPSRRLPLKGGVILER